MFPFLLIESSAPGWCQGCGRMAAITAKIISKPASEKKAPEIMNLIDIEKRLLEWN
jgi:hypothetical protein